MAHDLEITLGPAGPLTPGLPEGHGLLIKQLRPVAVADLISLQNGHNGELDVFHQKEKRPSVIFLHDLIAEQEPGAGDGAARAELHTRTVEILRLSQKPKRISGRDPVGAIVLGIAIARRDLISGGEHLVHPLDVVRTKDVVGVKDEKAVECVGIIPADVSEQLIERITLADQFVVEAGVYRCPMSAGDISRIVRAVVRDHEHMNQILRIGLLPDALQQVGDHDRLIARADEHGKAVRRRRQHRSSLFQNGDWDINDLIGIANKKDE